MANTLDLAAYLSHEIEKVNADSCGQFRRRRFCERCQRPQVAVEEAERWSRTHRTACQIFWMGHKRLKRGGAHRHISEARMARRKSSQRPSLIDKIGRAGIMNALLAGVREMDGARFDDLQNETIAAIRNMLFLTNELYRRGREGANCSLT